MSLTAPSPSWVASAKTGGKSQAGGGVGGATARGVAPGLPEPGMSGTSVTHTGGPTAATTATIGGHRPAPGLKAWGGTGRTPEQSAAVVGRSGAGGNPFDRIRQMQQTHQTFAPIVNAQSNFETAQRGNQAYQNAMTFFNDPRMPHNLESGLMDRDLQRLRDRYDITADSYGAQRQNMLNEANLNRQGLGLDEQSIRNQLQMLGLDRTDVDIDRRGINADRHLIGLQRGFAGEDRDISTSEAKRVGKDRKLDINSDYTQRGAWFAPRRRTRQESNEQEMQATIQSANLGYRERIANLDRQATEADLREAKLDTLLQRIGLRESDTGLDLQRLGLNRQRLEQGLQHGLTMLGFDERLSLDNIMGMIDRGNVQQQQAAWQVMEQAWQVFESQFGDQMTNAWTTVRNRYGI